MKFYCSKGLALCLAVSLLLLSFISCSQTEPYYAPDTEEKEFTTVAETENDTPDDGRFHIVSNFAAKATIVYSERATKDEIALAEALQNEIQLKTGVAPEIKSDYVSKVEDVNSKAPEILVGLTNRPESVSLNAELERLTFAIGSTENKLVIVGKNVSMLSLAIAYLTESIMTSELSTVGRGNWALDVGIKYVSGKAEPTPENLMESGITFTSALEKIGEIASESELKIISGACTDGEYFYAVMRSASMDLATMSYTSVVVKYSLPSFTPVAVSDRIDVGLGADMDYDPVTESLVILHSAVSGSEKISYMTTGLLRLTQTVTLSQKLRAICALGDGNFAACDSDGKQLLILDKSFSVKERTDLRLIGGDISAITTDGRYLYVLTNAKTMLNVYTKSGEYVNRIAIDSPLEPQNITVYKGGIMVGFCDAYWSSGEIFDLSLSVQE